MATSFRISIPQPCAQPWAAMTPTADGRHCAACATEVVDFTRLTDAEILAYLARQGGRRVCALAWASQLSEHAPVSGRPPHRYCSSGPPQPLPARLAAPPDPDAAQLQQIIIHGRVFDGDSKTAVANLSVFINGTHYGTSTDGKGRFELRLSPDWAPVAGGTVELLFVGNPFDFEEQIVSLSLRTTPSAGPVVVRMVSIENRGQVIGSIEPPVIPRWPPNK